MTALPTKPERTGEATGSKIRSHYQIQLDAEDCHGNPVPEGERTGMFALDPFAAPPAKGDRVRVRFESARKQWELC